MNYHNFLSVKQTINVIRDIYKSRSKIIHGDYKQDTKNDELWFLQEIVRLIINRLMMD